MTMVLIAISELLGCWPFTDLGVELHLTGHFLIGDSTFMPTCYSYMVPVLAETDYSTIVYRCC